MTEEEAQAWLRTTLHVSRETMDLLGGIASLVITESAHQNLISAATIDHIWARHITDSAQLLTLVTGAPNDLWMDLGTGAGFPGIIIAALDPARRVLLVESRRKRIDFLNQVIDRFGLTNASVFGGRLETLLAQKAAIISARAFAPLPKLFDVAHRFSGNGTVWLLPKGRSAREELESVAQTWQGMFHVEQSVTDPEAAIIVARDVQRKRTR